MGFLSENEQLRVCAILPGGKEELLVLGLQQPSVLCNPKKRALTLHRIPTPPRSSLRTACHNAWGAPNVSREERKRRKETKEGGKEDSKEESKF